MSRILFLGEGDLAGPARYLAAVLRWMKLPFDHRPDRAKIPKRWRAPKRYAAIILSDYRYASFTNCSREWLLDEVRDRGAGLIMIGGWGSFTGLVGGYARTPIEQLLPVRCVPKDDRVNWASGSVLTVNDDLRLTNDEARRRSNRRSSIVNRHSLPIVCGYHRTVPKSGTRTWLSLRDLRFRRGRASLGKPHPLLVTGTAGAGRTAAFLTDCAPHWAGGLVDWGRRRITVPVVAGVSPEVGDRYLHFFAGLIRWAFMRNVESPLNSMRF